MSQDNINININETNPIVNIVSSEIVETIDINVGETIEEVVLNITEEVIQVNVNKVQGGGAVDSVNGQDGDVVLDADDISDVGTINKFVTSSEKSAITHTNRSVLDQITEAFTTALKTAYDSAVSWISTNGTNLLNHLSNTSNPHSTTATQVDALQRDGSNANSNINIGEYSFKAGQFELDQTPTGTAGVAITRWNDSIGSTETTLKGGNVVLKNGVDLVARIVNKVTPNTTLTKAAYQAVRVSSAQGQRLAVSLAQANNDNNSADTIGLVCETIPTNQEGFIITVGQLDGINTTGSLQGETWSDGDVLYLSPTTAGRLTNIKPTGATGHIVVIGYVEYAHQNNGKIYVKVMNGWELDELHNVNITSVANNDILSYNSSSQNWENKTISNTLGYTPQATLVSGTNIKTIEGQSLLGSGNIDLTKSDVGLGNVDNTSDLNKPISNATQTALNAKENTISAGTTSQYYRGDKTFQTLDKSAVGLGNVDNTSDANKPVSNATQTALNLKSNLSTTPRILLNNNPGITTTGTQTVCGTVQIDNLGTAWSMDVNSRMYKAGTTSLANLRVYLNDTANLSGSPTLLGISSIITAANRYQPLDRTFEYSGGVLRGINASNSVSSDESATSGQTELALTINLNTATTRYLVFSIERAGTAGDTVECRFNRVVLYPSV